MSYGRKPYYIYSDGNYMNFGINKRIPEDALKLIRAIGLDYDGYRSADNLMDLIDELCEIARTGLYKSNKL